MKGTVMSKRLVGKLAAAAVLGLAALAVAAPATAAQAAAQADVEVSPGTVAAGGTVHVRALACTADSGEVTIGSGGGLATASLRPAASGGGLWADVVLPKNTPTGAKTVYVSCGDKSYTSSVTVSPTGVIKGGTGLPSDSGPIAVAGLGALAAATGGGLWLLRRREADAPVA